MIITYFLSTLPVYIHLFLALTPPCYRPQQPLTYPIPEIDHIPSIPSILPSFHFSPFLCQVKPFPWPQHVESFSGRSNLSPSGRTLLLQVKSSFFRFEPFFFRSNLLSSGRTFFLQAEPSFFRWNLPSSNRTFLLQVESSFFRLNLPSSGRTFLFQVKPSSCR